MPLPLLHIDAFTSNAFAGNPAAVCLLGEPRDAMWMLDVAREMNLSETAFLLPRDDGFDLRWFSPTTEIDLCGHATLAGAHALWETGRLPRTATARFHTRSGSLTAELHGDWIELNFPATAPVDTTAPDGLAEALGVPFCHTARSRFDYLVEVDSEDAVRDLSPDFNRLRALPARGVIVTSRATTTGVDFVSRFFAPGVGIDEDPVTGSAHCALAPYWSGKLGRTGFVAHQLSPRGGVLHVQLDGDRVRLRGQAVTVSRGELLV